ncbi:hypothetical protein CHS0354_034515 [Potamilus streckersoni]|uniref:RRM domain-containing protein n=1 Tax=Potamilus streckersoni TaxID=2493646 RepID=A0AAE0SFW9_9BIVA|nr:hypothetical protein CHS0354_034515 [Potamilus streckersoni]
MYNQGFQRGGGFGGGRGRGRSRRNDDDNPESEKFRKIFIGGLSYETSEETLKEHFGQWGEIVDCVVMKDPNTKRSRGFGFITYKYAKEVDEAQAHRPHNIDGREVETKRAMPRDESGTDDSKVSVTKMFCGGLKDDISEDDLKDVFIEFGEIERIHVITDKSTGKRKGFCFITFKDYDSVDKAVLKKRHDIKGNMVEVRKAQEKTAPGLSGRGGGRGGGMGGGRGRGRGGFGAGGGGGYEGGSYSGGGGGGYGGGYGDTYSSGYGGDSYSSTGGDNWGGSGFGQNYGNSYGGGAVKGGGYSQRSQPYNTNYGSGGGGYGSGGQGYGGGGGYGGYGQ